MSSPARRSRTRVVAVALGVVALVAGGLWLRDFLPASQATLESRAEGQPGVLEVVVRENEGDGLPFPLMRAAHGLEVVMSEDVTTDQVLDVYDLYGDDLDDGDLSGATITLAGAGVTLTTCCAVRPSQEVVAAVLGAAQDPSVLSYDRLVLQDGSDVEVTLEPLPFEEVVAYVDASRAVGQVTYVGVTSGDFVIVRDTQFGPKSLSRIDARLDLVALLDAEFGLAGALVADRSALELRLSDPADQPAARRRLEAVTSEADIGKVRFTTSRIR